MISSKFRDMERDLSKDGLLINILKHIDAYRGIRNTSNIFYEYLEGNEEYKSKHSDWAERDPAEIGKHFKADYVIYLEINSLGIYELGSGGTLYRGRADINISLLDLKNPDESQPSRNFTCQYPKESRMQVTSTDQSPMEFRQSFLDYVGKRISWKFAARPTRDDFYAD